MIRRLILAVAMSAVLPMAAPAGPASRRQREPEPIRFVQLEYDGENWSDGLDKSSAGRNLLLAFYKLSGGYPVVSNAESMTLAQVEIVVDFPSYARMPPMLFMTGTRQIAIDEAGQAILRNYCFKGGTLFADCASPRWHVQFQDFARKVFPGKPLVQVADDDPLLQVPFALPSGAPPLWHHGGRDLKGIKHEGRWIVIYHPGDVHDAWKTGHSGLDPQQAVLAYQFGVNVCYHAFLNYRAVTGKKEPSLRFPRAPLPDPPPPRTPPPYKPPPRLTQPVNVPRGYNPRAAVIRRITEAAKPQDIPADPEIDLDALDKEINVE